MKAIYSAGLSASAKCKNAEYKDALSNDPMTHFGVTATKQCC